MGPHGDLSVGRGSGSSRGLNRGCGFGPPRGAPRPAAWVGKTLNPSGCVTAAPRVGFLGGVEALRFGGLRYSVGRPFPSS